MQISVPSRSQTRLMKNPLHSQLPQGPVSELPVYTRKENTCYKQITSSFYIFSNLRYYKTYMDDTLHITTFLG